MFSAQPQTVSTADEKAEASEGATLQGCLQGFFQQETITWECPAEKQARRDLRRTSLGTDNQPPATPTDQAGGPAPPDNNARRTVSFSGEHPAMPAVFAGCHLKLGICPGFLAMPAVIVSCLSDNVVRWSAGSILVHSCTLSETIVNSSLRVCMLQCASASC